MSKIVSLDEVERRLYLEHKVQYTGLVRRTDNELKERPVRSKLIALEAYKVLKPGEELPPSWEAYRREYKPRF